MLDMMAMSKFIKTTLLTRKMRMIHTTAQSLVISSKNNSPATRSRTQPCTYAFFSFHAPAHDMYCSSGTHSP